MVHSNTLRGFMLQKPVEAPAVSCEPLGFEDIPSVCIIISWSYENRSLCFKHVHVHVKHIEHVHVQFIPYLYMFIHVHVHSLYHTCPPVLIESAKILL